MSSQISLDPRHQEIGHCALPFERDFSIAGNFPPLRQAVAATAGACVLRNENRMAAHRRLPPIVWRIGRRQACAYEIFAVPPYRLDALFRYIAALRLQKVEAAAELRLF